LPGRNANAYSDPHAFTYRNSDRDGNSNSNSNGDGDGYGDNHTISISYAYADSDAVADPHPASADAKAATNAVSSTDAVSGWIRKLKELKSYRELARPCPHRYAKRCGRGNSRVPWFAVDRLLRRRW
jgi:hypothetical protein